MIFPQFFIVHGRVTYEILMTFLVFVHAPVILLVSSMALILDVLCLPLYIVCISKADQERKEKFPITLLQNCLSELTRRGFNDRVVNAFLLEHNDYEMDKVLDRLTDPSSKTIHQTIFSGLKVHSFDEDNLEALWDAAREAAAHRRPIEFPHYKAPAGLAYHAASLHVGVELS